MCAQKRLRTASGEREGQKEQDVHLGPLRSAGVAEGGNFTR